MKEIEWQEEVPGVLPAMVKELVAERYPNITISAMRFGVLQKPSDVLDEGDNQYIEVALEHDFLESIRFHWNAGKALQSWDGKSDLVPRFADLELDRIVLCEVGAFIAESKYQLKVAMLDRMIANEGKQIFLREMKRRGLETAEQLRVDLE